MTRKLCSLFVFGSTHWQNQTLPPIVSRPCSPPGGPGQGEIKPGTCRENRNFSFYSHYGVPWLFLKHDSMNIEAKTESNLASDRVTSLLTSRWSWPCATIRVK